MKPAVKCFVVIAALACLSAVELAAQQQPPSTVAPTRPPQAADWPARQMPEAAPGPVVELPEGATVDDQAAPGEKETQEGAQLEIEADAYLLPIVFGGFWAMPPGGLTRYVWEPPVPINPESTLSPVEAASQCPAGAEDPGRKR